MGVKILPNVCTSFNLLLGLMAMAAVIHQQFLLGSGLIVVAALMDRLDGILARRLQVVTQFGKELDSLADLVSFGVAPALLAYAVSLYIWTIPGLACISLYVLGGAYRLARFNVAESQGFFIGLPITVAGAMLAVALALTTNPVTIFVLCLLLAWAMVSSVRLPKI